MGDTGAPRLGMGRVSPLGPRPLGWGVADHWDSTSWDGGVAYHWGPAPWDGAWLTSGKHATPPRVTIPNVLVLGQTVWGVGGVHYCACEMEISWYRLTQVVP